MAAVVACSTVLRPQQLWVDVPSETADGAVRVCVAASRRSCLAADTSNTSESLLLTVADAAYALMWNIQDLAPKRIKEFVFAELRWSTRCTIYDNIFVIVTFVITYYT